jgi:2-hydroxy-3-oxopropionate reductase
MTSSANLPAPVAPVSPVTRVGFVGLGTMGLPMATHVLDKGFELHVTGRRKARLADLIERGAHWHDTAADLAASADVVVVMVPDFPQVEEVVGELLPGFVGRARVIVGSTVSPGDIRGLDGRVRSETSGRVHVIDAPVSGGESGAVSGQLAIMVGADPDDFALVEPVLAAMGQPTLMGGPGSGEVAKAANQMVVAATVAALAEAAVVAERSGLDVDALLGVLEGGYASSRILTDKKRRFVEHDHSPSGAAKFMIKDLRFAREQAASTDTPTPLTDTLAGVFGALTDEGLGDQDTAVVQRYLESHPR